MSIIYRHSFGFVFIFVLAGILAIVIVLVNIDLQQVSRSLYSQVADNKCSED